MSKRKTVILIGRLAIEPEKRGNVVYFDLSRTIYRNGIDRVVIDRVRTVGNQAGLVLTHLRKGDLCCVEGHYDAEISTNALIAEHITFLSSNKKGKKDEGE